MKLSLHCKFSVEESFPVLLYFLGFFRWSNPAPSYFYKKEHEKEKSPYNFIEISSSMACLKKEDSRVAGKNHISLYVNKQFFYFSNNTGKISSEVKEGSMCVCLPFLFFLKF